MRQAERIHEAKKRDALPAGIAGYQLRGARLRYLLYLYRDDNDTGKADAVYAYGTAQAAKEDLFEVTECSFSSFNRGYVFGLDENYKLMEIKR